MGNCCFTSAPSTTLGKAHAPAFEWKIYGFSALLERGDIAANSSSFHCCGYNWFLKVTPRHKTSSDGISYVALSLCLSRIGFNKGYIIDAVFEFSLYNQSNGAYCGRKANYSFDVKKTHSKKACMIPLEELLKSSDFLVDDSCVFGVRILKADISSPEKKPIAISKKPSTCQKLFLQKKEFIEGTYTWTMDNYLDMKKRVISPAFEIGGHKWYIYFYPLGDEYSTNSLSLFLHLSDLNKLPDPEPGMMIELSVSILNQKHGKHFSIKGRYVFAVGQKTGWGWSNLIPLTTFKDPSIGYLLGSKCILKTDITIIGSSS